MQTVPQPSTAGRLHMDVTSLWGRTSPPVGITRVISELANAVRELPRESQAWRYDYAGQQMRPVEWAELDRLAKQKSPLSATVTNKNRVKEFIRYWHGVRQLIRIKNALRHRALRLLSVLRRFQKSNTPKFTCNDCFIYANVFHNKDHAATYRRMIEQSECSVVFYCHDLIPIKLKQFVVDPIVEAHEDLLDIFSKPNTHTWCASKNTLRDLQDWRQRAGRACAQPSILSPGGDLGCDRASIFMSDRHPITSQRYILFVSTVEIRKNHRVLIDAYEHLIKQGYSDLPLLVFAGERGWMVNDLLQEIDTAGGAFRHVRMIEHLTDVQLLHLYENALFTVYPSFYEGWGIPVAESLTLGKVCICSNRSSLPEVTQGLAKLIEPDSPRAWAAAIAAYIDHPDKLAQDEQNIRRKYSRRTWADFRAQAKTLLTDV